MEPGNHNLQVIFNSERPDPLLIRMIGKNILECLDFIHSNNMMHGDIKLLNFVRFPDQILRLIDFNASALLHSEDGRGIYAGAKFSSGEYYFTIYYIFTYCYDIYMHLL